MMRCNWGLAEEMPDSGVQTPTALVLHRGFCLILASSSFRLHPAPLGLCAGWVSWGHCPGPKLAPKMQEAEALTAQLKTAQDRLTFEKFRWSKLSAGPSKCPALDDNVSYCTTACRLLERWWWPSLGNEALWVCAISGGISILSWEYLFGR